VTQQNAALVEQAAAAAESMREQAESLTALVARFKLDEEKMRAPDRRAAARDIAPKSRGLQLVPRPRGGRVVPMRAFAERGWKEF
ncbi:MAG: hypothetical protein HY255_03340, partial [Betaproteobacteria bacterium]|nr:hypothetical protein [Betaproteobacteria bacterium]